MTRAWPLIGALAVLSLSGTALGASPARERAVSALFAEAVKSPPHLRLLLRAMPKGGDLHNHLGGSVYAEDFLGWAEAAGLCVDGTVEGGVDAGRGFQFVPPPCAADKSVGHVARDQPFVYARLVDWLSTRGYQQGIGRDDHSGHTQFFSTFERFGLAGHGTNADELEVTQRIAAADHVSYVELDHDPHALVAWSFAGAEEALDEAGLAARYDREIADLAPVLAQASAEMDAMEAKARAAMHCGTPQAEAGCEVVVHYLTYALRGRTPSQVFRLLIGSFALADRDPRFVGVNIVEPEDWPVSLRDYDLHMAMFRFLEAKYPRVHRSLHAGELAFGQVAPQHMRDHIAKAVAAGAQRIGHGTGIAYEDAASETMAKMAREGVAVEINLTSNDVILGVKGADHPLRLYRDHGVPFVLSTDDEGVLRTDMTNEYVRAAREQGLTYRDLKNAARASLEFSFVPGASIWKGRKVGLPVAACQPSLAAPACRKLVAGSEKARLQADLEARFDLFETQALSSAGKGLSTR